MKSGSASQKLQRGFPTWLIDFCDILSIKQATPAALYGSMMGKAPRAKWVDGDEGG
jgi:hypothetical protein